MSQVCNVILTLRGGGEENIPRITDEFFRVYWPDKPIQRLQRVEDYAGGNKHMEAVVLLGAFNYFDWEALVNFLNTLTWEYPTVAQLFICDEHDDSFEEVWSHG